MEKILLRVTGVRPKMCRGKMSQAFFASASALEIKLLQRAFHPDIHRKRRIESIGEQQDTISDFAADTAQFHQLGAGFGMGQLPDALQIESAIGDFARGGEQVRRAKTHFAGAEFGFGGGGNAL